MKHRFETWFAGLLVLCMCFVVACVTEPESAAPTAAPVAAQVASEAAPSEGTVAPTPEVSRTEATDDDFVAPDPVTGLLPANVQTCVLQCHGDEGCIDCCHCAHPQFCCM